MEGGKLSMYSVPVTWEVNGNFETKPTWTAEKQHGMRGVHFSHFSHSCLELSYNTIWKGLLDLSGLFVSLPHQSGEIGPVVRKRSNGWTQWSLRSSPNLSSFTILGKAHTFPFSGYLQAQRYREKIVNRYTWCIRTSKALQTMKNKMEKSFEDSEISQICQRQRNRLYFFKGYTASIKNYFFSLLASFLGETSPQIFHYTYFLNISHSS